ncbi:MAG: 2-phosphosulfolactate phosphatase [candidate division KSB1 bacterium]|nr:2-phosphosulfolactate phosphatase [candidate division KSB1 bacterium]
MPPRTIEFIEKAEDIQPERVQGKVAATADVLRATSTIVTALENGCREVIPALTVEDALAIYSSFPSDEVVLGGERGGKKIPGFHLSNSPREYKPEAVIEKRVITTTTNGTRALVNSSAAKEVVVLSFLNLQAVVDRLADAACDLCFIAAGNDGKASIEDTVCCGETIRRLMLSRPNVFRLTPDAEKAVALAEQWNGSTIQLLENCPHGKFLQKIGFGPDIAFCAQLDQFAVAPVYANGRVRIVS